MVLINTKTAPAGRPGLILRTEMTIIVPPKLDKLMDSYSVTRITLEEVEQAEMDVKAAYVRKTAQHLVRSNELSFDDLDNSDDFLVRITKEPRLDAVALSVRWKPSTTKAMFYGGPIHGESKQLAALLSVIKVPVKNPVAMLIDYRDAPDDPGIEVASYKLNGWDTINRWWIYTL